MSIQKTPREALDNGIENVSRRRFLKQLGISTTAFVVATTLPGFKPTYAAGKNNWSVTGDKAEHLLNVFVSIDTDGSTSIVCHRTEMGQGIHTTVPQIIAEEMEADWARVYLVQGKADKAYGNQNTAGSTSIRGQYTRLRQIGAAARNMLEQAAANQWQVSLDNVTAEQHYVINKITDEKVSFGELANEASKINAPNLKELVLKKSKDFKLIGKEIKLFNMDNMVAGKAIYAQDIQLPDMLIASIQRPPVLGGKVVSFDATEATKVKGVVDIIRLRDRKFPVVNNPISGVAVLATNTWAAHEGRKLLKIEWEHGDNAIHQSKEYQQVLVEKVNSKGKAARTKGDVYSHQYDEKNTVEATYTVPYLNHTPMETPCAIAWVQGAGEGAKCTAWVGTQNPQWAQQMVAQELGLDKNSESQVELNLTLMGGAFGRKSKPDFLIEAVELSKQVQKPVKVVWTREDDIQHGFYHSISANYMKAELTETGADYWIQRVAYPPIGWIFNHKNDMPNHNDLSVGFADTPFELNNLSMETQKVTTHVRTGWLRAVACINNGFALGSFVDELAVKKGISTRNMWLNLLGSNRFIDPRPEGFKYTNYGMKFDTHPVDIKRMKSLINLICDKANVEENTATNEGWGIGFLRSFGSYVAAATKVHVENKTVKVLEMHTAIDCGVAVTPDRVIAQMEGAMVFGLSITLMGEISLEKGEVTQNNFHDAPVTRMNQSPPMFVHLVESDYPPGGVGEPGVPPIIPSITNAIFHASGTRIRDLPVNKTLSV
jgi:isoquinoline 1-oxidoreductase beta subunit